MTPNALPKTKPSSVVPLCPVFGRCGGCLYQDLSYEEELSLKENSLRETMTEALGMSENRFEPITASPEPYHYRHRLDLGLRRTKGELRMGFTLLNSHQTVEIESCALARKELSDFLPELKKQALEKMPSHYRVANLTVKTGDDGRVLWGGIGRGSQILSPADYLWTGVLGRRIFYSLDTFFQANLGILPLLMEKILSWVRLDAQTLFLDLYGGVGLFSLVFADRVKKAVILEESAPSIQLAQYNVAYHRLKNVEVMRGRVEDRLAELLGLRPLTGLYPSEAKIALVDPPRKGLAPKALEILIQAEGLSGLLYLSCNPESLVRDLEKFQKGGWEIRRVAPFDFFPKTRHLETLVLLQPSSLKKD